MRTINWLLSGMGSVTLAGVLSSSVSAQILQPTRFVDWCLQRSGLSAAAQITVDRLLHAAGTADCHQADEYLSSLTYLDLSRTFQSSAPPIADLTPLQSLTNLTELDLSRNNVQDIQALRSLVYLESLDLSDNKVSDLRPLIYLANLASLNLQSNWVSDLSPLPRLTQLTHLDLTGTQVTDLTPLQFMPQLAELSLGYARARDPLLPALIPAPSAANNTDPTLDFSPLRSLTQLTRLYILGGGQELDDFSWLKPLNHLQSLGLLNGLVTNENLPHLVNSLAEPAHLYKLQISYGSPLSDLTPLQRLPNLTELHLSHRGIAEVEPISTLTHLTVLSLSGNPLRNISSLQTLTQLQQLDLMFTPISEADCPVTPASTCRFRYDNSLKGGTNL